MTMAVPYGVALLFLVVQLCVVQGQLNNHAVNCPKCNGAQRLSACPIEKCTIDQQCAVQQVYEYRYIYYSGCVQNKSCDTTRLTTHFNQGPTVCSGCCHHYRFQPHCSLSDICPSKQSSLVCLHCNGENSLSDCNRHDTCGNNQKCYVRKVEVHGKTEYFSGCAPNNNCYGTNLTPHNSHGGRTLCHRCCADHSSCSLSDLCPENALTCLRCNGESSLNYCQNHETCQADWKCVVRKVENKGRTEYFSGCVHNSSCDGTNYIAPNSHRGSNVCHKCCADHSACSLSNLCPENALTCLKCNGESSLKYCKNHETCQADGKCVVRKVEYQGRTEYFSGCVHNSSCDGTNYITPNSHKGSNLCHKCCADHSACSLSNLCPETAPPSTLKCQVCSGPGCKGHVGVTRCGHPSDLCLTSVENKQDGTQIYSKRCATVKECEDKWLKETTLKPECVGFHPDLTYKFNFNCTFCCKTNGCNRHNMPVVDSLYLIG